MRLQKIASLVIGIGASVLLLLPAAASCSHPPPPTSSAPLISIVSEINPALPGPVTFFTSVKVPGASIVPTGSVTFSDGSSSFGIVALDVNGLAICTASLTPGSHEISVSYSGDGNFGPAKSGSLTESVTNADGTPAVVKTTEVALAPTLPPVTDVEVVD
jgi:Bacterial Ig-like domain (group 3)